MLCQHQFCLENKFWKPWSHDPGLKLPLDHDSDPVLFFLNLPSPPPKKKTNRSYINQSHTEIQTQVQKNRPQQQPPQPTTFASQADHNRPTRRSLEIPRFLELSGHVRKIQPLVAEIPEVPGSTTSFKGQAQQRQGSWYIYNYIIYTTPTQTSGTIIYMGNPSSILSLRTYSSLTPKPKMSAAWFVLKKSTSTSKSTLNEHVASTNLISPKWVEQKWVQFDPQPQNARSTSLEGVLH